MTASLLVLLLLSSLQQSPQNTVSQEEVFTKMTILKKELGFEHSKLLSKYFTESINKHNLPVNVVLAIAYLESNFNQGARGTQNDTGIMQVMPFWSNRELCQKMKLWHAKDNIECGCRILRYYLDLFDGNLLHAITGYNRGERSVKNLKKQKANFKKIWYTKIILDHKELLDDFDKSLEEINGNTADSSSDNMYSLPSDGDDGSTDCTSI